MSELIKVERWAKVAPFNPLSPHQVKAYIRKMGYPMPKHRTDRDEFGERKDTTNDESLSELLREGKPGEGDEVLEGTLKVRHISKGASYLAGTYVRPDGRLHPIYTMRPKQRLSCVGESAQALTRRGWRGVEELVPGEDELASYDLARRALVWSPLLRVHRGRGVLGKMRFRASRYENKGALWLACTPQHNWVVDNGHMVGLVAADEFHPQHRLGKVIMAAPGLRAATSRLTPTEAAILGWSLTDGTTIVTSSGRRALQVVLRKAQSIAALDRVLASVPHTRTETPQNTTRFYVGVPYYQALLDKAGDPVSAALDLDLASQESMWEAMMEADGCTDEDRERFGGQKQVALDVFGALATCLGKTITFKDRPPRGKHLANYNQAFTDVYVRLRMADRGHFFPGTEEEPVWCPETAHGTWVVRDNGTISITGNSAAPNVMTMPKGKKGKVLKRASRELLSSVVADPGFTLFSCDWNSLHPALIAYFAGDPQYARVARLGDHANVLSHYLGRPVDLNRSDEEVKAELDALKEAHPAEYKTCKIGNLAYKYLQGPMNMAKSLGLSLERTLAIRAAIDRAAPKVAAWKWKVLEQAHFKGRLVSPFGLPLSFFDVFRTENGKVLMDRDGKPKLGLEAPEACSFFPLSTESGMLREVLVDLGSQEECWSTFKLSIPEHDKVIGQIRDGEVDRILDSLVIPSMNRSWPELGGLRVGVDVEVGKTMQEMRAR